MIILYNSQSVSSKERWRPWQNQNKPFQYKRLRKHKQRRYSLTRLESNFPPRHRPSSYRPRDCPPGSLSLVFQHFCLDCSWILVLRPQMSPALFFHSDHGRSHSSWRMFSSLRRRGNWRSSCLVTVETMKRFVLVLRY
jgi:hypothetical protein